MLQTPHFAAFYVSHLKVETAGYDVSVKEALSHLFRLGFHCPRCNARLTKSQAHLLTLLGSHEYRGYDYETVADNIYVCTECGWWHSSTNRCIHWTSTDYVVEDSIINEGIVKRFDIGARDIPNDVLRAYIQSHINDVSLVDHKRWELLMRDIYSDFYDCEVRHIGGPGDNGIDLYAVINEEPHLIQIKRRQRKGVEGVALVREFVAVLMLEGIRNGHIVTTAERFSEPAKRAASHERLRRYGISVELKTIKDIHSMLAITNKATTARTGHPWEQIRDVMVNAQYLEYSEIGNCYDWEYNELDGDHEQAH